MPDSLIDFKSNQQSRLPLELIGSSYVSEISKIYPSPEDVAREEKKFEILEE